MDFTPMISRRDFLRWTGISAAMGVLPLQWLPQADTPVYGRLLHLAQVNGETLLPDSVHPIHAVLNGQVNIGRGWLPESALQPMLPRHTTPIRELPAWVEIHAPYAALRTYAQPDAPLVHRLGHGSVLFAQQALGGWLYVTLADDSAGWVQAAQVQPVLLPESLPQADLMLDGTTLSLYQRERLILQSAVVRPEGLASGSYPIQARDFHAHHDCPWCIHLAGTPVSLHGVTTHHSFGRMGGRALELPLIAAKAIFSLLPAEAVLRVH